MLPRSNPICQLTFLLPLFLVLFPSCSQGSASKCGSREGKKLRYLRGDALRDDPGCVGPDGRPYPMDEINDILPKLDARHFPSSSRQARMMTPADSPRTMEDVERTREALLRSASSGGQGLSLDEAFALEEESSSSRWRRDVAGVPGKGKPKPGKGKPDKGDDDDDALCSGGDVTPARLCASTYNTTAPMYGVSLTSGKPVTIVQKFPDLLQQVVFETCDRSSCDIMHGECKQTYVPFLFLVIPLGPVTLTGQDYVLVESGCVCRPKYAKQRDPDPLSVVPEF